MHELCFRRDLDGSVGAARIEELGVREERDRVLLFAARKFVCWRGGHWNMQVLPAVGGGRPLSLYGSLHGQILEGWLGALFTRQP